MNRTTTFLVAFSLLLTGCNRGGSDAANDSTVQTSSSPKPVASPMSDFEEALQFIRNGQFTYIWVFSRKDGKPFEPSDSEYLRTNAPQVVDWARTKDGLKVVAGTNFNLEEGNLEALRKRFVTEDYSGR